VKYDYLKGLAAALMGEGFGRYKTLVTIIKNYMATVKC
jgi:hypothetical protein